MLTDEQFDGIEELIEKNKDNLSNVRLLMITPKRWLRLYKGNISRSPHDIDELFSQLQQIDRGSILDMCSKMEFLVNEMIQTLVIGYDLERSYKLDAILENIPFVTRLRMLKEWGLFHGYDDKVFYKIKNVMDVRNRLAHRWSPTEAEYRNKSLSENFRMFKDDLKESINTLIDIYGREQDEKLTRYSYELDKGNYNTFLA
jgi:hypothetical protein